MYFPKQLLPILLFGLLLLLSLLSCGEEDSEELKALYGFWVMDRLEVECDNDGDISSSIANASGCIQDIAVQLCYTLILNDDLSMVYKARTGSNELVSEGTYTFAEDKKLVSLCFGEECTRLLDLEITDDMTLLYARPSLTEGCERRSFFKKL